MVVDIHVRNNYEHKILSTLIMWNTIIGHKPNMKLSNNFKMKNMILPPQINLSFTLSVGNFAVSHALQLLASDEGFPLATLPGQEEVSPGQCL